MSEHAGARVVKHKVADLEGALLDAAVAMAEGWVFHPLLEDWRTPPTDDDEVGALQAEPESWQPSTDWAMAGPIIERERIELSPYGSAKNPWQAQCTGWPHDGSDGIWHGIGPTPLIAAMRAYVASRFGEEIELP